MRTISPKTLKAAIRDQAELAIVDAREEGEFGHSHLFWAAPLPLSKLPLRAPKILPRKTVRVVVTDAGEGHAARAAAELEALGYTDVSVLEGGIQGWKAAGYELFSGANVPSKAFGEWVEHAYATPSVDPTELKALQDSSTDLMILDSRPWDEFSSMTIPGAVNVPGGELALRIAALAPRPETLVVVNCAGRTRSILGAQSLRSFGVPNRVVALRNGTMGWELAGLQCDRAGAARFDPKAAPAPGARARAERLAALHGVGTIDVATLARWNADPARTLYLFDVRDHAEFEAGHLPGSLHAPGGQLVQSTDAWIAVLRARVVLVGDDGVRTRMTGQWLAQLGHRDVHVLDATPAMLTARPPAPARLPPDLAVTPVALKHLLDQDAATVIDLSRSIDYRKGHIPGARWAIRTRLSRLGAPPEASLAEATLVLTAPDPMLALLTVPEAEALGVGAVKVLAGGTAAWQAAGLPIEADKRIPADADCADFYLRPYDRNEGVEAAMHAYLDWEIDLPNAILRDGDASFGPARA
jgi:rhodanese-related sulfurtransferase